MQLYDQLLAFTPTPVVALNRAIAVAELDGPEPALAILDRLDLGSYHLYHAARADLLDRSRRLAEAPTASERALELTSNEVEQTYLRRRLAALHP